MPRTVAAVSSDGMHQVQRGDRRMSEGRGVVFIESGKMAFVRLISYIKYSIPKIKIKRDYADSRQTQRSPGTEYHADRKENDREDVLFVTSLLCGGPGVSEVAEESPIALPQGSREDRAGGAI